MSNKLILDDITEFEYYPVSTDNKKEFFEVSMKWIDPFGYKEHDTVNFVHLSREQMVKIVEFFNQVLQEKQL